jgi:fluoride ion exporter CrcB/FEX
MPWCTLVVEVSGSFVLGFLFVLTGAARPGDEAADR